jgi:hypothetical protein
LKVYLDNQYQSTNAVLTKKSPEEFASVLKRDLPNSPDLSTIIYCISYLRTFQKDSNSTLGMFNGWNNNFATLPLDNNYGELDNSFLKTYSCVNTNPNPSTKGTKPIANFESIDTFVSFMVSRLKERVPQVLQLGLNKYYACYWPVKNITEAEFETKKAEYVTSEKTFDDALTSALTVGIATKEIVEKLKNIVNPNNNQTINKQ